MDRRLAAICAVALVGLGVYAWPYYQAWQKRPDLWADAVSAGVDINEAVLSPPDRHDYAHDFSPVELHLEVEAEVLGADGSKAQALADRVAEEATWSLLIAGRSSDIREAELNLWRAGRQKVVMEEIARQLRLAHVIYGVEETYFWGLNPEANAGNFFHLDCDLIAHVFLHAAFRMDLDVREHNAPLHVYLSYGPPKGALGERLTVEPTEFRSTFQRDGVLDLRGQELGLGFFVSEDHHRTDPKRVQAVPAIVEAAAYYEFATDRDIRDSVVDSVALGAERLGERQDRPELVEKGRASRPPRLEGTRDPNLVTNHWLGLFRDAWHLAETDPAAALAVADEMAALEVSHGHLLLYSHPLSPTLRMRAHRFAGEEREALALAEEIHEVHYRGRTSWAYGGAIAWDAYQAEALYTRALLRPGGSLDHYNQVLLPILNFDRAAGVEGDEARLADVYRKSAWILTGYGMKETARDYYARAEFLDPSGEEP